MGKHPNADFNVLVEVHVNHVGRPTTSSTTAAAGQQSYWIAVRSDFTTGIKTQPVPTNSSSSQEIVVTVAVTASKNDIALWWPNGMGEQPLYNLDVALWNHSQYQAYQKEQQQQQQQQQQQSDDEAVEESSMWIRKRVGKWGSDKRRM